MLARRFSPRAFAPDVPSDAQLARLFTAACWAPSAGNGQPWRIVVGVHGDDVWPVVLGCLNEKNQAWCRHVPVLGIAIAQTLRDDKPLKTGPYDLGQAMADLTVQATTDGLYVHQMAGFSEEAAREAFAVPAGFTPWTAYAIGSLGDPETLPDDLKDAGAGARGSGTRWRSACSAAGSASRDPSAPTDDGIPFRLTPPWRR